MKRLISGKMNSKKGASLMLALLLFLVCAVVGSVILTAGTAASGRISSLREMDQRYYAVMSAAELFRDALGTQKVIVERGTASGDGTDLIVSVNGVDSTGSIVNKKAESLLIDKTVELVIGQNQLLTDAYRKTAWERSFGIGDWADTDKTETWTLSVAGTGSAAAEDYSDLEVAITGTVSADGRITCVFANTQGKPFRVQLVLIPSIEEKVTGSGDTTPKKKTTYVEWSVSGIRVLSS